MRALLRKMAANEITEQQITALVRHHDPKKGFGNKDIDRMVQQLKGLPPPEPEATGGGGPEDEPAVEIGPGGVRQIPASDARGRVPGTPSEAGHIEVVNGSLQDAGKTDLRVTVAVVWNNQRVAEVYGVAASALPDLVEGEQRTPPCSHVIYHLKQEIVVKQPAPGIKSVGVAAGNIAGICLPVATGARPR